MEDLIVQEGPRLRYRPRDGVKYFDAILTVFCAGVLSTLTIIPLLSDRQPTRKNEVPPPDATTKWWSAPERFEPWRFPWEACSVIWGISGLMVLRAAFQARTTRGFTFDGQARTIVSWRIRFGKTAILKTWQAGEFTNIHLYTFQWTPRYGLHPVKSFGIELRGRNKPLDLNGGRMRHSAEVQALAGKISGLLGYKVAMTDNFPDTPESKS